MCVKAGLKVPQIATAIARCSRLVKFFRKSSRAAHILSEKQEALGVKQNKLIQDVDTRCNSTHNMAQRVLEQQSPICSTLLEQKRLYLLLPKDEGFGVLEELVNVLKPFKEVTAQVSAELYVTSSAIRLLLCHLTENALKIELTNPIAIKN